MAKKLISVRVSDEVDGMVKTIADKRQSTQANIIEEAVRNLAKKEKITSKEIEDFKEKHK